MRQPSFDAVGAELSTNGALAFGVADGRPGCPARPIRGGMGTQVGEEIICQALGIEVKDAKVGKDQAVVVGHTAAQAHYQRWEAPPLLVRTAGTVRIEQLVPQADGRLFVRFRTQLTGPPAFTATGWLVARPESCLRGAR